METSTAAADPAYITPAEAAEITHLSTRHLSRMADAGKIGQIKPGGTHRRYLRSDVEALVR